ncbi:DUF4349 domain-containing protein [Streptomyces sp. NPDC088387]|uniref:DUF4349 domain-containing protein n=1 Tax=Streptomyces sp. NPDC088387 TaxID=3365859 RepID=UPI00381C03C8
MRTRQNPGRPVRLLAGLLLAGALALTGCTAGGGDDSGGEALSEGAAQADSGAGAGGGADEKSAAQPSRAPSAPKAPTSHIIRTASLTVQVEDVPKTLREARTAVEGAGGYIGEETTTRDEDDAEYTEVALRVPVERYEKVVDDLEGVGSGKLLERSTKAQDVTDQVVDVESRIQSQRASVTRIRELMDRAERLSDVVTLEGELSRRQADLEALLAQQSSLEDRTSLATINLTLSESPVDEDAKDDDPGFGDALSGGWDAFVGMLRWILVAVGAVLPFLVAAALLLLVWLRLVRPRLPRRAEPAPVMTALGPLAQTRPAREADGDDESGGREG